MELISFISFILFLSPILFVMVHVFIATRHEDALKELVSVVWAIFFLLLFVSNQLAAIE